MQADFVFKKDHKLISIPELDKYIKDNGHLPEIPTSEEVKRDGIELGKMNAILLQKIEELSLYIINQQKEIEKLKEIVKTIN